MIIGNGGAEFGVRGYVSAYDAETGKLVWRFYTVPGDPVEAASRSQALEKAAKTWNGGEWWKVGGGGTAWDSMAYDPELEPALRRHRQRLAVEPQRCAAPAAATTCTCPRSSRCNADTGEYVWHYQTTPGDNWDYTATQHMILADLDDRRQAAQGASCRRRRTASSTCSTARPAS